MKDEEVEEEDERGEEAEAHISEETKYFPTDLGAVTWMPKGGNRRDEKMRGKTKDREKRCPIRSLTVVSLPRVLFVDLSRVHKMMYGHKTIIHKMELLS